ncbi:uncharacterized protein N7459_002617 [Penicillium hispanicum]|uniref:uncharacterized protein n=1 Tax=Penicillium hispanicum TaxID=1080232 RepID=UPI002542273F|nr:uncharacterized protein N7459_002617 [Penicillium hispanicum]KAJ5586852.1 hypothetical protein N7459_002617 [Penicillium hispanicum]
MAQTAEYVIVPQDGADSDTRAEIESYLKNITHTDRIRSYTSQSKNKFLWWVAKLDDSQVKEVEAHDGIQVVEEHIGAKHHRAIDRQPAYLRSKMHPNLRSAKRHAKMKREQTAYSRQQNAVEDLRQISIPEGRTNLADYPDYIYESKAGEGIYIYMADLEMPQDRFLEAILTPEAEKQGKAKDTDDDEDSHGTCLATKAGGEYFGGAKKAYVVPIKMAERSASEMVAAYDKMIQSIKGKREGIAVISNSVSTEELPLAYLSYQISTMVDHVNTLDDMGVPFINSAGNEALEKSKVTGKLRTNVDTAPGAFAGDGLPVINVGAVDFQGNLAPFSARGDLVSIYAQGVNDKCLDRNGNRVRISGTSIAAPIPASYVATLLSDMPEDLKDRTGADLTFGIKYWIENLAYWTRPSGYKVLWNGVSDDLVEAFKNDDNNAPIEGQELEC